MITLLTTFILVTLSELGDKSQFLILALISAFKKPYIIIFAIICGTFVNYSLASLLGILLKNIINSEILKLIISLFFIIVGVSLFFVKPKQIKAISDNKKNIFISSIIAIFLIEIGDKSELIVMSLSAHYKHYLLIILGSMLGFLLINLPVVFFGNYFIKKIQLSYIKIFSGCLFLFIAGILILNEILKDHVILKEILRKL